MTTSIEINEEPSNPFPLPPTLGCEQNHLGQHAKHSKDFVDKGLALCGTWAYRQRSTSTNQLSEINQLRFDFSRQSLQSLTMSTATQEPFRQRDTKDRGPARHKSLLPQRAETHGRQFTKEKRTFRGFCSP